MFCFATLLFQSVRGIGRHNYRIGMRLGPFAAELNVLLNEFLGRNRNLVATNGDAGRLCPAGPGPVH